MLKSRLIYGSLMIGTVAAILWLDRGLAPYHPWFFVAVVGIVWTAAHELGVMLLQRPLPVKPWLGAAGSVLIVSGNWLPHVLGRGTDLGVVLGLFVAMGMLAFLLAAWEYRGPGQAVPAVAGHLFIFFYVAVLGSFIVQLRWDERGPAAGALWFLMAVFVAKTCDIAAYFCGRRLGRHRLAPLLSPGKTVEGALGGLIVTVPLAITMVSVGKWIGGAQVVSLAGAALFGLCVGLAAQWGDLMESLIKRDGGQKDASAHIPGFGGLLDVIDSVLFAGPVAYLFRLAADWS